MLGIPYAFVETSSFWYIDDESTNEKLTPIKSGLHRILISVNPFARETSTLRTGRVIRISKKRIFQKIRNKKRPRWGKEIIDNLCSDFASKETHIFLDFFFYSIAGRASEFAKVFFARTSFIGVNESLNEGN